MRVIQLIDSLDAGGAERMAVNYANELANQIDFSAIAVSRKEGYLKKSLKNDVPYFFIKKTHFFDFKSIFLLKKIILENKIDLLHSHGTSFFSAFLLKVIYFKIKIVHHEHYGNRANESIWKNIPLLFCSFFFDKILVVNHQIEEWFDKNSYKKAIFFPNFATFDLRTSDKTILKGEDGKRIVCLANLKNPKNHVLLIRAFHNLEINKKGWSLHFIGKNYNDGYFKTFQKLAEELDVQDRLFVYDSKSDVQNILSQATIGVLCSLNEGFPVTLLEYGLSGLPVVASNVGYCSKIISHDENGLLFDPNNVEDLAEQLKTIIFDKNKAQEFSGNLYQLVLNQYSKKTITDALVKIYTKI